MFPLFVKSRKDEELKFNLVPCGKCPNCLANRASAWSFRLMQEEKRSTSSHFVTLTYDTNNVQITRNGYLTIKKRDLQLFFKRLRKLKSGGQKTDIRYYAVGEYGGRFKRPHYHIILFNADPKLVVEAWSKGLCHFGTVTGASVGYTLKYISKPYKNFKINDDREKPFSLMSKGIGENYLTPSMVKWHRADLENRVFVNLEGGKKCTMPRYYKLRLYNDEDKKRIEKAARVRLADKLLEDLIKCSGISEAELKANVTEAKWAAVRVHEKECVNA